MLLTLGATIAGLLLDPRVITGAPAWLKPAKFAVSISIYCLTLLWLLTFVRGHPRLVAVVAWGTAVGLAIEEVIIIAQVMRGTTSHFNEATALDGALFSVMGALVVLVWALNLVTIVLLLVQRLPNPAFAWALRLGLVVSFAGMAVAFLMIGATPEQLAAAGAAGDPPIAGAHSVGAQDGGPGLPLVGWSTVAGDLRAGHFVGLHALQVLPVVGWLIVRLRPSWLGMRHRVALVCTAGLAYLGLVLLLAWQALRGQPVVAPGAVTVGVFLALAAAAVVAAAATVLLAWRARQDRTVQ